MSDTASVERTSLLPEPLRRPLWLIGTLVVPQLLLLLLNFHDGWLVAGELSRVQATQVAVIGGLEVLFAVAGLGAALWLARVRVRLDWPHGLVLLLAHSAFLWFFTASFDDLIPRSVPDWMLPRGTVLYHQYALMMPALLHGALLVACFAARRSLWVELGGSAALVIGTPLAAYFFLNAVEHLRIWGDVTGAVIIAFFTGLTSLLVMALLRLLLLAGQVLQRAGGHGRLALLTLVGIAGPLGGLVLNVHIPFPADFQSVQVYVLALLNGLFLLLPVEGPRLQHRLAWLAQCALFAFTTYFMVVFLPFLPLALLAIVAVGSGLLMLVPLVLFVLHAQQLAAGWRAVRAGREVAGWTAAAVAAALLLPGGFALRTHLDREALHAALDHVHSPDYAQGRFTGDLAALQRGLENLRDFKAGLQLPFLSGYYNQMVFGGLVLPDTKLRNLYLTFFGRSLPDADPSKLNVGLFGSGRRGSLWGGWRGAPPPTNTVDLVSLETVRAVEGDCETATATLVLKNGGSLPAEFVTQLRLPPGVFVSGYWLHINGERVAGRVFEKKAALWVYEMIRDMTRRDPGLVLYRQPDVVELRVFPLAAGETRTTEIELIWPLGMEPPIRLAEQALDTAAPVKSPPYVVAAAGEQGRLLVVAPPRLRESGATPVRDPPYLHVLVDASVGADPKALAGRARELAKRVAGVREVVVSAANFEVDTPQRAPESLEKLDALAAALTLPARGGFCRDRALKSALAWHEAHAPQRPVVLGVVMADGPRVVLPDEDLAYFAAWHPSVAGYLESRSNGVVQALNFRHEPVDTVACELTSLAAAGSAVLVPLQGASPVAFALPVGEGSITNERYLKAAGAWLRYVGWLRQPAGREEERARIVEASRAANVLTPLSSFIVVENSAQWRLLEDKEKQKLANQDALEIQKAPEPATWLLAGGLFGWMWWRRKRCGRQAQAA
jgi:hypothetical protein